MAKFVKGQKRPPGAGRKKISEGGPLNRMTIDMDEALAYGGTQLKEWLRKAGRSSPGRAIDVWTKVAEFRMPKLQRQEVKNADDKPFVIVKEVRYKDGDDNE